MAMRPLILSTGHIIADTVASSLAGWLGARPVQADRVDDGQLLSCDFVIGYGVLRGSMDVFHRADTLGKPWFVVDRGYLQPGHFTGTYRIGFRGTQARYTPWEARGDGFTPIVRREGHSLVCPPTPDVAALYRIDRCEWIAAAVRRAGEVGRQALVREKGCERMLADDLAGAGRVDTFNSSVGWQALWRGLPVLSDEERSTVGSWRKVRGSREQLHAWMQDHEWTLGQLAAGEAALALAVS